MMKSNNTVFSDKKKDNDDVFTAGSRDIYQLLAQASVALTSEKELKVENNYVKTFVINGYPANVWLNWMDYIYSYDGDMDTAIYIEPTNERTALDALTEKITQYESQLMIEIEKGGNKNVSSLQAKIKALYDQRAKLEQNYENMFHVSTFCALYNSDLKELNKDTQRFLSRLSGRKINMMPLNLRHDDGYKTCSPFGILSIPDYSRNMNTGALSTMFPFYNPDFYDPNGTFLGINVLKNTIICVDLFNRKVLGNANLSIFGASGSGKTFLVTLIIFRSCIEGIRHFIIDVENEYGRCCDIVGGVSFRISPNSNLSLNPFDLDEEIEVDEDGNPTGRRYVDIKGKVSELLNLFGVMFPDMIDSEIKAEISETLLKMYYDFGFSENPESLYIKEPQFNSDTGEYVAGGKVLKTMPRMSDFYERFKAHAQEKNNTKLDSFVNAMKLFVSGGIYDMFDCYTTVDISKLDNTLVLRFDIHEIEDEVLRPIVMYVVTNFGWSKFMKKDIKTKKRIVVDEAWLMLSNAVAGSQYTAHFLENCARRIRKYNGSLCCSSQNFREFLARPEGEAILSCSAVKVFLKQEPEDIAATGNRFYLSDGEKRFLLQAKVGDALMKIGKESVVAAVYAFPFEYKLISKSYLEPA